MENRELLERITHNKLLLFIVPNFIYMTRFLYVYNNNFNIYHINEILFRYVILSSVLLLGITFIFYLLLRYLVKDEHKVFILMYFICNLYLLKFDLIVFLLCVLFILVFIIILKKIVHFNFDYIIFVMLFMLIFNFGYNLLISFYNVGYYFMNTEGYSSEKDIVVDDSLDSPNIYWIHSDATMSMEAMNKYFNYDNEYLREYLTNNNYYVNKNSQFVGGHHTNTSLVALFNPYYYDNFFGDFLYDLEEGFLNNSLKDYPIVSYTELRDRRLNNELFMALESKGYTTYAIGEFNQYSSLLVDYYYDYYYKDDTEYLGENDVLFKEVSKDNNSDKRLSLMTDLVHFNSFFDYVSFNILNYNVIDYNDIDVSDYYYLDNTDYWVAKAIIKGIDLSMDSNKKFIFVDYRLNHLPLSFDADGKVLSDDKRWELSYYVGNYIYSSYLLVDILEYIMRNDENAIIILQGDHGMHCVHYDVMMDLFDVDMEGVQEIRNSVISAVYIPSKYKNDDDVYLSNPLNISRYLVNNYVGDNYEYLE